MASTDLQHESARADDTAFSAPTCQRDAVVDPGDTVACVPGRQPHPRSWTPLQVPDQPSTTALAERHLRRAVQRIRLQISAAEHEYVVVHSGTPPSAERVDALLTAVDELVPWGARTRQLRSTNLPDICLGDDGTNPILTRTWQQLVREGAHAVTVGPQRATADRNEPQPRSDSAFVIRVDAIAQLPVSAKKAFQRPAWWAAVLVVTAFAVAQIVRIVAAPTTIRGRSALETRWLEAARSGSVDGISGPPLPGSSLWPALARPFLDAFGIAGLRWMSLILSVIAIATVSAASSRLFGRWAARTTSTILAIGLLASGVAIRTSPAPLAMAAMGVMLLGVALVEGRDRRSWILMSGLAATVAVIALYPLILFVLVVIGFFTLLRGRRGVRDSLTFGLVVAAGLLAWFLPTRVVSSHFVSSREFETDWNGVVSTSVVILAASVVAWFVILRPVTNMLVRTRVVVLCTSVVCIPIAKLLSRQNTDNVEFSMAMLLIAPALGGALAYRAARRRSGHDVTPAQRKLPEILTVDPSTGRIRNRMIVYANRQVRLAMVALILSTLWYLPWAALNIEWRNWWITVPFLFANTFLVCSSVLSARNNWSRAIPIPVDVARCHEPLVGVIVPTYGEPLHMVVNTVRSIFDQDWPADRLRVIVSDDAHDDRFRDVFVALAKDLPLDTLRYHRPPKRGDPRRRGESKSGNLNSALLLLDDCEYIETRDADDLVGSWNFLRATVSQMMDDPGLGFVQTIKETMTSVGDPFNNNEPFFYRGTMLARNSDGAVFPCGSGLVWRRTALRDIGEFPTWNLVEDLHSGVLALRAGWRGLYVPIVGANAQHSPEDVANMVKQRGTWALDTTRLLFFDRFRGLPRSARRHFIEQGVYYLLSIPLLVLLAVPAIGLLLDRFPLETDPTSYAIHFWAYALSIELLLLALAADQPAGSLWRSRIAWVGMAPVYALASIRALWYGPQRKPTYKVTRKTDEHQVYVKLMLPSWVILIATTIGVVMAVLRDDVLTELDLGSLYWGILSVVGLGAFLRLSWFGVDFNRRRGLRRTGRRSQK